jgi:enoyl-CoA hydratase
VALRIDDLPAASGGLVRLVTLDRPEKRNALDAAHLRLLDEAFAKAAGDERVRALVLQAEGPAFCGGYDLSSPFDALAPDGLVVTTMQALRACEVPVVAVVEGPAVGAGLELALSADFRVASEAASFCLPPARLGIAYGPAGLARLAAVVGTARARRMVFTAETVPSREALRIGLVDEVVAPDSEPTDEMLAHVPGTWATARERALQLAGTIAAMAPKAVRLMKRTFDALEHGRDISGLEPERRALFASQDVAEGLRAQAERRTPRFTGH